MNKYDAIVVGSGFAGSIMAERLANVQGKKVLLIEKRKHIAGNMYDCQNNLGLFIHQYGPHIFRTHDNAVIKYLSNFTHWFPYQHRVLASIDKKLVPVPFNLVSLGILFPGEYQTLKKKLIKTYGIEVKVPVSTLKKHVDLSIQRLGQQIFEKIYLNYTVKQWGDLPENLDFETITKRVPVHISFDDRYFQQKFQALPLNGYTAMFEKMLAHENIDVLLDTQASERLDFDLNNKAIYFDNNIFHGPVIYSGPIDEAFSYQYGELPYRSLHFDIKNIDMHYFQPTATVNYPNDHDYTRITEFKHMVTQKTKENQTTVMYEYPEVFDKNDELRNIPYYPIPKEENYELYKKYLQLSRQVENLILLGRLAEYRYYDMSNIVSHALDVFNQKFLKNKTLN